MPPITRTTVVLLALFAALACSSPKTEFDDMESVVLTGESGIALGGYDPVAYFEEGVARIGEGAHVVEHAGATYRFASQEHRDAFAADPERYVPAYGGWCAWALADGDGQLVEVDPESWIIQDGRLLLFYDGFLADTRSKWTQGDREELARDADRNWGRITSAPGE